MTTVTLYVLPDGQIAGYDSVGHASGRTISRKEYDLICSAVSALTQTGVNALETVAGVIPEVEVSDGCLKCRLPEKMEEGARERANIVVATVVQGLQDIAKSYPKHIRIMTTEWRHEDA